MHIILSLKMSAEFKKDGQHFGCGKCLRYYAESDHAKTCFYGHGVKPSENRLCDASCDVNCQWKGHIRRYTDKGPFTWFRCDICSSTFRQKSELTRHMGTTHTNENNVRKVVINNCEKCGARLNCNSLIMQKCYRCHIREQRHIKCELCEATFTRMDCLKQHMRSSSAHVNFTCDKCSTSFHLRYQLEIHKSSHRGDRSIKCDMCRLTFVDDVIMGIHKRSHTVQQQ